MPYMKSHSLVSANASARPCGMTAAATRSVSVGSTVSNGAFAQPAVDAQARPRAHLHVDVRGAVFHGEAQQSVQVQHTCLRTVLSASGPGSCSAAADSVSRHRSPDPSKVPAHEPEHAAPSEPLRIVQWTTGNVGRRSIIAAAANPGLEIVGCFAWGADKVGRDVGELCGIEPLGVLATDDVDALLALAPDCVVYNPKWPDVDEMVRILEAGVNIVSTAAFITGHSLGDGPRPHHRGVRTGWRVDLRQRHQPGLRRHAGHRVGRPLRPGRLGHGARVGRLHRVRLPRDRDPRRLRPSDRRPRAARHGARRHRGVRGRGVDGRRRAGRRARRRALRGRVRRRARGRRDDVVDHPRRHRRRGRARAGRAGSTAAR